MELVKNGVTEEMKSWWSFVCVLHGEGVVVWLKNGVGNRGAEGGVLW